MKKTHPHIWEIENLVSALKNVGIGLGPPRAGPPNQLLPGDPDHFAAVFGGPVRDI